MLSSLLFAKDIDEGRISQKLIIGSSNTAQELEEVKHFCANNSVISMLQETHQFSIKLEPLGEYNVTVIEPLLSIDLRNTLFIILSRVFDNVFYMEVVSKEDLKRPQRGESTWWVYYGIGLQWLVLLLLSLIGLLLSIRSRRKLAQLMQSQQQLQAEQRKMEHEIKGLGGQSE
jgi:hypothetical protein